MHSFRTRAALLLAVATSTIGGRRLSNGSENDADADSGSGVSSGHWGEGGRHTKELTRSVDAGNGNLPVPFGAAVEGEGFPKGVSANGVLMVDIATGGRLPEYIAAQVAAAFNDTAGALMAELDSTYWTAAGSGSLAPLIFNFIFQVNAGRLFCFTRDMENSDIDGEGIWSNWRQAEATPVFAADGTAVAFEASAEPRFSPGWRFSIHPPESGKWSDLGIKLSGYSLCNVTRTKFLHGRLPLSNKLPLSVDAGNGSSPVWSGAAVEGMALPRKVSVNGLHMLRIATGGQLPEDMFTKAASFMDRARTQTALLDGTVWTAACRARDSIESLIFNVTFAVSAGRLFCFTRYRARSAVDGTGVWSNWRQAEARPVFGEYGKVEFKASAEPRLTAVAFESSECMPWFSPGWTFSLNLRPTQPLEHLKIRLFGSALLYVTRAFFEFLSPLPNDLPMSVDAGNGSFPVRFGAAVEGDALPRGVSIKGVRAVKLAVRNRLPQDVIPKVAAFLNETAGGMMAELDGTEWTACGQGPIDFLIFNLTFAANAGRLFCFTRYMDLAVGGGWSRWRQGEARPVLSANGTVVAFEAPGDPRFSGGGWRFSLRRWPTERLSLQVKLFGYRLSHVKRANT